MQHLSHLKLREFRICTNDFGNRQSRMPLTVPTTSVRTSSFASAAARAALTSFSGRKPSSPTPFSAELANQPRCRVTERSSSQIPKVQSNLTSGRTECRTGFGQRRHQSQAKRLALTKRNHCRPFIGEGAGKRGLRKIWSESTHFDSPPPYRREDILPYAVEPSIQGI